MSPEELVDARRLPLPHRRAHARRGAGDPAARASRAGGARPTQLLERRLPGLHHHARLARLLRRRSSPGCAEEAVADGLHPDQAEGRRRPRRRRPAAAHRPRGRRPGHPHRGRRQPALGRRRRDRLDARARAVRPVLDRGADQPRRRARPRRDPRARSRRSRSPPASTCRTGSCSSSCCRPGRSTSCRSTPPGSAGVNENIAILLLAAKFGVPVCPHAGGVGLCELVQHLSMFDYVAVSGTHRRTASIEYVDHLHEHFVDPVVIERRPLPRARRARASRAAHDPGVARRATCSPTAPSGRRSRRRMSRAVERPRGRRRHRRRLRHRPGHRARCWPRAARGSPAWTSTRRRPRRRCIGIGATSPTTRPCGRRSPRRPSGSAASTSWSTTPGIGARGHGRATTPTTSGTGCSTSTSSAWSRVTRAALPHLRRSAHARSSTPARSPPPPGCPQRALYSATKGAVLSLTLAMAADHVREGIRVNCVNPGTADTPWVRPAARRSADDPAAERAALEARQPMGGWSAPRRSPRAIAYLAGPAAGVDHRHGAGRRRRHAGPAAAAAGMTRAARSGRPDASARSPSGRRRSAISSARSSDEDGAGALDAAWDAGIRYFDTAPHYGLGLAERRLGDGPRRAPATGSSLSTKVGRLLGAAERRRRPRRRGLRRPADARRRARLQPRRRARVAGVEPGAARRRPRRHRLRPRSRRPLSARRSRRRSRRWRSCARRA